MSVPNSASLVGLPAELRVSIFEHALLNASVKLRHQRAREQNEIQTPWSLLQINRQTRSEVFPIFYQAVEFRFVDGFSEEKLRQWLCVIGDEAVSSIKKVIFHCKAKCSMYGLTPDTDYCHREAFLDMNRDTFNRLSTPVQLLCSNEADGCGSITLAELAHIEICSAWTEADRSLESSDLLAIWKGLTMDHSDSAA